MPFAKGRAKTGGKKAGTENKTTKDARALFTKIMEGEMAEIQSALAEIRGRSAFNYIVSLSKLMPYFMPKQLDIKTDGEKLAPPVIQILPFKEE